MFALEIKQNPKLYTHCEHVILNTHILCNKIVPCKMEPSTCSKTILTQASNRHQLFKKALETTTISLPHGSQWALYLVDFGMLTSAVGAGQKELFVHTHGFIPKTIQTDKMRKYPFYGISLWSHVACRSVYLQLLKGHCVSVLKGIQQFAKKTDTFEKKYLQDYNIFGNHLFTFWNNTLKPYCCT